MEARFQHALESLGLRPRKSAEEWVVSMRMGAMKREARFNPEALFAKLPSGDERAIAANAARGILAVVNEPGNSRAAAMNFIDTTAVISPYAEGPGFEEGVFAAGGSAPFFQPYVGDLRLAYYVDLDDGQWLVPASHVAAWGVHPERVEKAGLSILFHRSGYERWENHLIDGVLLRRMAIGDGGDAARGTLLEMYDYHKAQTGRYFAAPDSGMMLFTDDLSDDALRVLQKVAKGAYEKSDLPLSRGIFKIEHGKLATTPIAFF